MEKNSYIYIMTNKINSVLYVGVTSNLKKRIYEHRKGLIPGFTQRYKIKKLVYYEVFNDIRDAIVREKQIKAGTRDNKEKLIKSINEKWVDLYDDI